MASQKLSWEQLQDKIREKFAKNSPPDLNAVLFLIGLQELGHSTTEFTKEQKQDLMHIAMCRLFSNDGYFRFNGLDQDGWPHWESVKKLPEMSLKEQEDLLKKHVLRYFDSQNIFSDPK